MCKQVRGLKPLYTPLWCLPTPLIDYLMHPCQRGFKQHPQKKIKHKLKKDHLAKKCAHQQGPTREF